MSNKVLGGIKRTITQCCVIFTAFMLLVFIIGSAVPDFGGAIDLKNVLVILFFSLIYAAANLLLHIEGIAVILRILLHYAATAVGFYVVFVLIAAKATAPSAVLVMLLFYTLLYAILMGAYQAFVRPLIARRAAKTQNYERIYK